MSQARKGPRPNIGCGAVLSVWTFSEVGAGSVAANKLLHPPLATESNTYTSQRSLHYHLLLLIFLSVWLGCVQGIHSARTHDAAHV